MLKSVLAFIWFFNFCFTMKNGRLIKIVNNVQLHVHMNYPVGTKVHFRFTGEAGTVVGLLEDGLIQVQMDEDSSLVIPAFEEDLEPYKPPTPTAQSEIRFSRQEAPPEPLHQQIKGTVAPDEREGILLAFEPMQGRSETVSKYKAWLVNASASTYLFYIGLFIGDDCLFSKEDKLDAGVALELGNMDSDDLNDLPDVEIELKRISTAGVEEGGLQEFKIKPKQFFNKLRHTPVLNLFTHAFLIPDQNKSTAAEQNAQSLREYTKQNKKKQQPPKDHWYNSAPYRAFDIEEFSTFEPEIDLHIEALTSTWRQLDKAMILRIQLEQCTKFLDRAIRLGAHQVYLIHGVGEGKLRDAIKELLTDRPEVVRFKNEYHHKYGYGATEVFLR